MGPACFRKHWVSHHAPGSLAQLLALGIGELRGHSPGNDHRLAPIGRIAGRIALRAGMALETQEYLFACEPAQIDLSINPFLAVGVPLEERRVICPDAERHAVAGRLGGGVVPDGVGEEQSDGRDIRQLYQVFGEDRSAGGLPRRVHHNCMFCRTAGDLITGEVGGRPDGRTLPADRHIDQGFVIIAPGHALGAQGPERQGAVGRDDVDGHFGRLRGGAPDFLEI